MASRTAFEHQRTERWVESDHDGVTKAISYTVDGTRTHDYYLATRTPR